VRLPPSARTARSRTAVRGPSASCGQWTKDRDGYDRRCTIINAPSSTKNADKAGDPEHLVTGRVLHALFTGLAAAETADAYLLGDHNAVLQYRQLMDGIQRAYNEHLALCYASETRWPSSPF
jgi:hypothetical protein